MLTLGLVLRREKDSEKSVFAKCVRHCRSRDPEDSCGASDACSNYKSSKFTG
uniref:Uncharacterized protein n=1 Tax=Solanum tuberosum TaxID=4113 RepID=M1APD8_SOLTU